MKRFGQVIKIHPEKISEYRELHDNAWPEGLQNFLNCNLQNYTIFLRKLDDGNYYLFAYGEYTGDDYEADMKKLADMPLTQEWWDLCKPCQEPLATRLDNEWWSDMEEIFHIGEELPCIQTLKFV